MWTCGQACGRVARHVDVWPGMCAFRPGVCGQVGDEGLVALAEAIYSNYTLHTIKLSCCIMITDEGVKAMARALEHNSSLTSLDLSWCRKVGEPGLAALTQAMARNRSMTRISLTGCKCVTQHHTPERTLAERRAGPPPLAQQASGGGQGGHVAQLMHYLQLNGKRPKNLAASALAATDKKGKILAAGGEDHGRQCSISQRMAQNRGKPDEVARAKAEEAHVRRTLRAAIINGAAMCAGASTRAMMARGAMRRARHTHTHAP